MNTFKVTYTDGTGYVTSANGTRAEFEAYLMQDGGIMVDENPVTGEETRRQIAKVEEVYSRKDYLDGKCEHSQYYAQFVNAGIKYLVEREFGIVKLIEEFKKDEHFNGIPLESWDNLTNIFSYTENKAMREAGDYPTLGGLVCILKEAARQIVTS